MQFGPNFCQKSHGQTQNTRVFVEPLDRQEIGTGLQQRFVLALLTGASRAPVSSQGFIIFSLGCVDGGWCRGDNIRVDHLNANAILIDCHY